MQIINSDQQSLENDNDHRANVNTNKSKDSTINL